MANNVMTRTEDRLHPVATLVGYYVVVVAATIGALVVLRSAAPHQATADGWVHAIIVAAFAVLLPLRLRAARRGSVRALRAVPIIAATLLVVNVVEAAVPGMFPIWMRIEMVGIAALMLAIVVRSLHAMPSTR